MSLRAQRSNLALSPAEIATSPLRAPRNDKHGNTSSPAAISSPSASLPTPFGRRLSPTKYVGLSRLNSASNPCDVAPEASFSEVSATPLIRITPLNVIASEAKQSRSFHIAKDKHRHDGILATTCPHNPSYKSIHSELILLIRSTFLFREPALICFSLAKAECTSLVIS